MTRWPIVVLGLTQVVGSAYRLVTEDTDAEDRSVRLVILILWVAALWCLLR